MVGGVAGEPAAGRRLASGLHRLASAADGRRRAGAASTACASGPRRFLGASSRVERARPRTEVARAVFGAGGVAADAGVTVDDTGGDRLRAGGCAGAG